MSRVPAFKRVCACLALVCLALVLLAASPQAAAQDRPEQRPGSRSTASQAGNVDAGTMPPAAQVRLDARATELIGAEVRSSFGEQLGRIEDLYIDLNQQRARYAVLVLSRFPAAREQLFAVPMHLLYMLPDGGTMVLHLSAGMLEKMPGFKRNASPEQRDPAYFERLRRYFAEQDPASPPESLLRASALLNRPVHDRQGRPAGRIEDVVIDTSLGQIAFVALETERAWQLDRHLLPLPLSAFQVPREARRPLVVRASREQVAEFPRFPKGDWPALNARRFRREVEARFEQLQGQLPGGGAAASGG